MALDRCRYAPTRVKPPKPSPDFPLLPHATDGGPSRSTASSPSSARGKTRTVRWSTSWPSARPCSPGVATGPWPETVEALKASLRALPEKTLAADRGLVFITRHRRRSLSKQLPGVRSTGNRPAIVIAAIAVEFRKLCNGLRIEKPKPGFYALRHTFRTVADEVGDRRAIDMVMGHENGNDISTHYVERIADERLRKVTEHVRGWLYPAAR